MHVCTHTHMHTCTHAHALAHTCKFSLSSVQWCGPQVQGQSIGVKGGLGQFLRWPSGFCSRQPFIWCLGGSMFCFCFPLLLREPKTHSKNPTTARQPLTQLPSPRQQGVWPAEARTHKHTHKATSPPPTPTCTASPALLPAHKPRPPGAAACRLSCQRRAACLLLQGQSQPMGALGPLPLLHSLHQHTARRLQHWLCAAAVGSWHLRAVARPRPRLHPCPPLGSASIGCLGAGCWSTAARRVHHHVLACQPCPAAGLC